VSSDPDATASTPLKIEVLPSETQVILRLEGELDSSSAPAFAKAIAELDASPRPVLLDMAGVSFIDSTGVGAVVAARRTLDQRFASLRILNPRERARFVFELTGLGELIVAP
jgi:anti-anti-sigma factor